MTKGEKYVKNGKLCAEIQILVPFAVQPWQGENISISWVEPLPNIKVESFIVAMLGVGIHLLEST
jgi:hypothetical protein